MVANNWDSCTYRKNSMTEIAPQPIHGGDILTASKQYGIATSDWLDISTGLNPEAYPTDALTAATFQKLPYIQPDFIQAAISYYGNPNLLAINGIQTAIKQLPSILKTQPILLPEYGYSEYQYQWQQQNTQIKYYPAFDSQAAYQTIQKLLTTKQPFNLVIINPNNPTGMTFNPDRLRQIAEQMPTGSYLIIDEAFIDLTPQISVLQQHLYPNMIVLRSFGKFFGLAGIRLGFIFAAKEIRLKLQQKLGLWHVNGPAQALAIMALTDNNWQQKMQQRIRKNASMTQQILQPLMDKYQISKPIHTPLFSSYCLSREQAQKIEQHFGKNGVLIRRIKLNQTQELLRFGIINAVDKEQLQRLKQAITNYIN